nr:methyltransferase [Azospirillum sp. SYSU D00513]
MTVPADSAPEDFLLGGRVRLTQPEGAYRAAIDPVLLAAFTAAREGERVLDVGAGTGAASLCLAARVSGAQITGLEQRADAAAYARRNIALNEMEERVALVEGDLLAPPPVLAGLRFDRVMMNPPYLKAGAASVPPDDWKAAANVEGAASLPDWLRFAARMLKPRGTLTLVHRADRLDEILAALHGRFGGVLLVPVWPKAGEAARRVLLSARLGGKAPFRLSAGLTMHEAAGGYTEAAERVLRGAEALEG